jgi:hypothetical protein
MNLFSNFKSITTRATLEKKDFFFLELVKLVLRQKKSFFSKTISVSSQLKVGE